MEPTIFKDVSNDSRLAQQEIFGPVLAVIPFEDEEEALRIANGSRYGLAAGVWTKDMARAFRMSRISPGRCGSILSGAECHGAVPEG